MRDFTDTEKAYYETIIQVARSPRPEALTLRRMALDGNDVAVIGQTVLNRADATERGWQPLAIIIDRERAERLRDPAGGGPESVDPSEVEGAA